MRVMTTIPQHDLNRVPDTVNTIEGSGYDGIFTLENRHDPFMPLSVAAVNSKYLELGTGIAIAFARSPMVVANIGWDLQRASKGRFVLGLGSQIRGHNERRFSVPWSAPAPRLREYVEALRAIWKCWKDGDKLDFEGEHYNFTLMTPNFVPEAIDSSVPRVTIAAVGPGMIKVAAEVCDGIRLHPFCTRAYLKQVVLPIIDAALKLAGKTRSDFEIVGGGFLATGPNDESVQKMINWTRKRIAFYGSTPAYWPVFAEHDLEELGQKLNHMSKAGKWDDMEYEVSDEIVDLFTAAGRHDQITSIVEKRFGGISDTIIDSVSSEIRGDLPPDVIQDIQQISSSYKHAKQ